MPKHRARQISSKMVPVKQITERTILKLVSSVLYTHYIHNFITSRVRNYITEHIMVIAVVHLSVCLIPCPKHIAIVFIAYGATNSPSPTIVVFA